jgi:hypothetical protein
MKRTFILCRSLSIAVIVLTSLLVAERPGRADAQQVPGSDPAPAEDAEALLRGPLHEAFAGPIALDPQSGLIVPKMPPEAIEEIPPEAKPADEDVIWIPGYWAWDEDRDDFIYISGVWRVPPGNHRWVPGYWSEGDGGWQWISGFWTPVEAEEIRYLPTPPRSLEAGPTSPQPSSNHTWVNGCWLYRDTRYVWRPGYWNAYHDGWVWVPSHYSWTPHGSVFVGGYWDYPYPRRGVVFAPVWFSRPIYARSGYSYSPRVVVDISRALLHMFVYPRRCHYYWGDYYGYRPRGGHSFHPWYNYHGRHGYDPMFAYYSSSYRRHNIDYGQRLRGWHDYFQRHEEYRPARTLHAQAGLAARMQHREPELKYALLGNSVSQALARSDNGVRLERIADSHRQEWKGLSDHMRDLTRRRSELETGRNPQSRIDRPERIEAEAKPELRRPDERLRLPELPQIAKGRWEDSRRTDEPRDANTGRGGNRRDDFTSGQGPVRDGSQSPETSRKPPRPDSAFDADRPGQPDPRSPEGRTPRSESPKPSREPDAVQPGQPESRTPSERPKPHAAVRDPKPSPTRFSRRTARQRSEPDAAVPKAVPRARRGSAATAGRTVFRKPHAAVRDAKAVPRAGRGSAATAGRKASRKPHAAVRDAKAVPRAGRGSAAAAGRTVS